MHLQLLKIPWKINSAPGYKHCKFDSPWIQSLVSSSTACLHIYRFASFYSNTYKFLLSYDKVFPNLSVSTTHIEFETIPATHDHFYPFASEFSSPQIFSNYESQRFVCILNIVYRVLIILSKPSSI